MNIGEIVKLKIEAEEKIGNAVQAALNDFSLKSGVVPGRLYIDFKTLCNLERPQRVVVTESRLVIEL
jgi:hypothetical protein